MNINNLKIELDPRFDKDDNIFHIGRLRSPIVIDLSQGVTFLVFLSEDGSEEVQLAINDRENTTFSKFTRRKDRLKIRLEKRSDKHKKNFLIAKIQADLLVNCFAETAFIVFTSKEGAEELQIVGDIQCHKNSIPNSAISNKREVEVTYRS